MRRLFAALLVCVVPLSGAVARSAPVASVTVTLSGPTGLDVGQPGSFTGRVSVMAQRETAMPAQRVALLVDGAVVAEADTDANGAFAVSHAFASAGSFVVRAVVQRGRQLESSSEPITVRVGPYTLSVVRRGFGSGSVSSSPAGIACPPDCSEAFPLGVEVVLTATPEPGSSFTGWVDNCRGAGTCTVVMDRNRVVTASFADAQPPVAPVLSGTTPASPANHNAPVVAGTAEPGTVVRLWTAAACGGTQVGSGTAQADGSFSITASVADNTTTTLRANARDVAGNVGPCSNSITYVEDSFTSVPALTSVTPASPANHNLPTISGTASAGDTVRLYANGSCSGVPAATMTATGGAFSAAVPVADNTTTTFRASATDSLGNVSGCSPGLFYVEDSTAPQIPTPQRILPGPVANDNRPRVFGSAEPGSTVFIYTSLDCDSPIGSAVTDAQGEFAAYVSVPDDSETDFYASAQDAAGNTSRCGGPIRYVEDSTPPAAPSLSSIAPASPANNNAPVVSGTSLSGTTVRLFATASCSGTPAAVKATNADGTFSVAASVPDDSSTSFAASAVDEAGNVSTCSNTLGYIEDSTAPLFAGACCPVASASSITVKWPKANDAVDRQELLRYEICWSMTSGACASSWTPVATVAGAPASLPSGYLQHTLTGLAGDRTHYIVVRATDRAGNRDPNVVEQAARTLSSGVVLDKSGPCFLRADGAARCEPHQQRDTFRDATVSDARSVSYWSSAACVVKGDRSVWCWGRGPIAGTGPTTGSPVPVKIAGIADALKVDVGYDHACALIAGGTVRCWGNNVFGQIGDGTTVFRTSPAVVLDVTNAVDVATGRDASCAALADGRVKCWGDARSGIPTAHDDLECTACSTPRVVPVRSIATKVFLGGASQACALASDGGIECWGVENLQRPEGYCFGYVCDPVWPPRRVTGVDRVKDLTIGVEHVCALRDGGKVLCWGSNHEGGLGRPGVNYSHVPTEVPGLSGIAALDDYDSCAAGVAGVARCWGYIEPGDTTVEPAVVTVQPSQTGAWAVSSGLDHTCTLFSDGSTRCWGRNDFGQLGDGTQWNAFTPRSIGVLDGIDIAAGALHTCIATAAGLVKCWGLNNHGQIGNGTATPFHDTPQTVFGIDSAVAVSAGEHHSCAVALGGRPLCWGRNADGQLGDGTFLTSTVPALVSGISTAMDVAAGGRHSCALLVGGLVRCWGRNDFGQLGNGTTTTSNVPVAVTLPLPALAIAAGDAHTCAVLLGGAVRCWGRNDFTQLGVTGMTHSTTPVAVSAVTKAASISAGFKTTCAALLDGTARCWGRNAVGELGNGTTGGSSTPVAVSGFASGGAMAVGGSHVCALVVDGGSRCWGRGFEGQLGRGSSSGSSVPVSVVYS